MICQLTRNEESQVAVAQHRRNSDQARSSTRHNTYVLPCVLALPPLAVVLVVQLRDRLSQRPDTSGRTVFSAMGADVNLLRPLEASLYAIVDLRRTLAQVCPFFGLLEESVFVGLTNEHENAEFTVSSVDSYLARKSTLHQWRHGWHRDLREACGLRGRNGIAYEC